MLRKKRSDLDIILYAELCLLKQGRIHACVWAGADMLTPALDRSTDAKDAQKRRKR